MAHEIDPILGRSFVPLQNLNEKDMPDLGWASSTWVKYNGRSLLLTVAHAVTKEGRWVMEVEINPETKETLVQELTGGTFFKLTHKQSQEERELDFVVFALPEKLVPLYTHNDKNGILSTPVPRIQFDLNFDESKPSKEEDYIFSGRTVSKFHPRLNTYDYTCPSETIRFHDIVPNNAYSLEFRLGGPHPGHDAFEGCSGSPIVGKNSGNLVSIVARGVKETDSILGIRLELFRDEFEKLFPKQ